MSKHMLCTGRVVNGGRVEITRPTLEQLIDMQMARNEELLAMHRDLDALIAGKPVGYKLTQAQLEEIENEAIGREIGQNPWQW